MRCISKALISGFLFALPSGFALASVQYTCAATNKEPVKFVWSATRSNGTPRFGPYSLEIAGKRLVLWPLPLEIKKEQDPSATHLPVVEVGYYVDRQYFLVKLLDEQADRMMVTIEASKANDAWEGGGITQIHKDGKTRKFSLRCAESG